MSYQRMGYPLTYFEGESKSYVFVSSYPKKGTLKKYKAGKKFKNGDYEGYVEDYKDIYKDNCSFIELIGTIIRRETEDKEYAEKIIKVLAKKLKVEHKLRKKPLTANQWLDLTHKRLVKWRKLKVGRRWNKILEVKDESRMSKM